MQLRISTSDGVPIYLQIVAQIKYLIAAGRLEAGQELPPMRILAQQLMVNPNPGARAYREMEAAGFVEKRRTARTYVAEQASPLARKERVKLLTDRIDALLVEARQVDIEFDDVVRLLKQRHVAMKSTSPQEA